MNGSVIHCPFIVVDTHVTEPASGWLPGLTRAKYVPCMTAITPVFYNSVTLSATSNFFSRLSYMEVLPDERAETVVGFLRRTLDDME